MALVVLALVGDAVWTAGHFLQPAAPRHIVLASDLGDGLFDQYAKRYVERLARSGAAVEERMTAGAEENLRLLESSLQFAGVLRTWKPRDTPGFGIALAHVPPRVIPCSAFPVVTPISFLALSNPD